MPKLLGHIFSSFTVSPITNYVVHHARLIFYQDMFPETFILRNEE